MQAEAVADLVDAVTPLQARAAFDQLEGTLTDAIREIDAALFDLDRALEASLDFPTRAITSSTRRTRPRGDRSRAVRIDRLLARCTRAGASFAKARRS